MSFLRQFVPLTLNISYCENHVNILTIQFQCPLPAVFISELEIYACTWINREFHFYGIELASFFLSHFQNLLDFEFENKLSKPVGNLTTRIVFAWQKIQNFKFFGD